MPGDPIRVALRIAEVLEECGVRYLVGGSLASSVSGEPRSTLDIDVVAEFTDADIARFVAALGNEFYADVGALREAIASKSSANLIHYESSVKVDLFIMGGSPIDEQQMDRRQLVQVTTDPERYLYVYTAEDIILQKLRWFRMGDEVSDRQWRDILGIVMVQGEGLDGRYLREAARILGVSDLLERALAEANNGPPT